MSLCKCGCGLETMNGNDYIHGHNRRNLASYTTNGKWSMYYDACIQCGTTERKYVGKGLCTKCHRAWRYRLKKENKIERWAKEYDKCVICGRTNRPHAAGGLCINCYDKELNRKKGKPTRVFGGWSWYHERCKKCGTTKRPHVKAGLCCDCYEESKRVPENLVECPVCGVKICSLNQHLSMRSKKCKKHANFQKRLLQKCFDSELNMTELSKELDMDRHAITRLFIKYFGKEDTNERNEKIRRWNISKAVKINFNYKNMYGKVIWHNSPNQGIIRMRSKTEGRYADNLDLINEDWWYEKHHFPYIDNDGIKRTYTPDFYLPASDKYIEVKGVNILKDQDLSKIKLVSEQNNINIEIVRI